jgi:hypothetical protein
MRVAERCSRAGRCVRRGCPRSARHLYSGAQRSASGAMRRVASRRSLCSPSVRAHSEAPMKKCFDGRVRQDQSPSDAVGRCDVLARRFSNYLDIATGV